VYAALIQVATSLRRLHVELDLPLDDVVIDVHPDVWKHLATRPELVQTTMKPQGVRWNEMLLGGVVIREAEPGTREHEDLMLKRGCMKAWVVSNAR